MIRFLQVFLMRALVVLTLCVVSVLSCCSADCQSGKSNTKTTKIKVIRELYIKYSNPRSSVWAAQSYVNPTGLELQETRFIMVRGDEPMEPKTRYSKDNGRTWSKFEHEPAIITRKNGNTVWQSEGSSYYDPASGFHLSISMRQSRLRPASKSYTHCFWRASIDGGKNWTKQKLIRYEKGADFDPNNPFDPDFLEHNQMYAGSMIRHSNGTVILAVTEINIPEEEGDPNPDRKYDPWQKGPDARNLGSMCVVFRWDEKKQEYELKHSNCAWVPMSVSSGGLQEAAVVELTDGRVLIVWRGLNTDVTPGHKWFSVSEDGGLTLTKVRKFKYDDGTDFYSPASIHKLIRHSVTGKLYWVGNITPEPPDGAMPRYPLVIVEVDETIPALKKNTVTIIDDRRPGQYYGLQLSNFSLHENRETHNFEIFVTHLGTKTTKEEPIKNRFVEANCYKYTLSFP